MQAPAEDIDRNSRWRNSLIARVIVLCAILLLCLLGSVYVISRHYFHQLAEELDERTLQISSDVQLWLENNPNVELDSEKVRKDLLNLTDGVPTELKPVSDVSQPLSIVPQISEGQIVMVATRAFMLGDQPIRLTAYFAMTPHTELVRAFKNRYLLALTAGFVVALGLMVFVIAKTLRPLRVLSASCAQVAAGELRGLEVHKNYGEVLALERTFNKMVASLRDKEMVEARLRQAQRLSAIGTLAAGIAHDIRNPLNAIKLLSSHALDGIKNCPDAGPAAKHLETIKNEVGRLEAIVSSFLSLAKEHELRPEPCRIDGLLEECIRLVKKDAEARAVNLVSELRAGDTTLMLDPKQWNRAILNVLLNAMEACRNGGRVRVHSRATDRECEIEIRDDGPGMSPEVAERAFEPYFTTKSTGTGLGLSITRGIVEEHGGTIELFGGEGIGCQVLIRLPRGKTTG